MFRICTTYFGGHGHCVLLCIVPLLDNQSPFFVSFVCDHKSYSFMLVNEYWVSEVMSDAGNTLMHDPLFKMGPTPFIESNIKEYGRLVLCLANCFNQ